MCNCLCVDDINAVIKQNTETVVQAVHFSLEVVYGHVTMLSLAAYFTANQRSPTAASQPHKLLHLMMNATCNNYCRHLVRCIPLFGNISRPVQTSERQKSVKINNILNRLCIITGVSVL